MTNHPSRTLASFAADLSFAQIPDPVLRRAEDLMLDWLGSVLAARSARPIRSIQRFAEMMGPAEGPSEMLTSCRASSPVFAALVKQLDRHAANFAIAAEFDMRGRRLALDGIWVNVMEEGGMHASHVHPHSAISGTYYVTMPGGAAAICYEDPRSPLMMSAPPRAAEARTENKAFVSVNPKEDTLLLWESWLRHGVEMQAGRTERISISFNYRIEAPGRMP